MEIIQAEWPAPFNVHAFSTTRSGGFSSGSFTSNNQALHVDDEALLVNKNREQLQSVYGLPNKVQWLNQTHSTRVVKVDHDESRDADASISDTPKTVLAILTADCLPIVLCNQAGDEITAIHAGWRGLINGVIENTLSTLNSPAGELIAWIGPAICGHCFEISEDITQNFYSHPAFGKEMVTQQSPQKYLVNLPALAENILQRLGVPLISQSNCCTFEQQDKFYSYRRQKITGRIATLIWFD